jgi:hypothetical protein
MDQDNPAVQRQTSIPPALLEQLDVNAKAMTPTYLKMVAVQANHLHFLLKNPNIPLGQRMQAIDLLAKLGGVYASASAPVQGNASGPALSVQIVFSNEPPKTYTAKVVEAEDATIKTVTND